MPSARLVVLYRSEVGASLPADRMRPRARPQVYAAEPLRGNRRAGEPDDAGNEERELRAADGAQPAGEQSAEWPGAVERVEVEADHPPAQPVGSRELHRGVRVRRPHRESG